MHFTTIAAVMATYIATAMANHSVVPAPAPPGLRSIAFPSKELHKFRSKAAPNGYFQARIPAVVLAGNVLVAMGECARCVNQGCNSYVGWSADICSKRSFDDGLTWHNFTVIAVDGSQPDLVYDSDRQHVVLNFNLHRTGDWPHGGKNMMTTSDDFGATWTTPVELPSSLGLRAAESGPGRGLRLTRGANKGRLLFSGWRNLQAGTPDGPIVWRTDDGGKTFATAPSFTGGYNEGQLAESDNGTVVVIFRVTAPGVQASHGRGLATSVDGGETFSNITLNAGLRSPACQASILGSKANGRVYYSSPSDLSARRLGLLRSSPDGVDWSNATGYALTLGGVGFGYSSLTELGTTPGHLGLLWELQTVGTHLPTDLAFSHVPLDF